MLHKKGDTRSLKTSGDGHFGSRHWKRDSFGGGVKGPSTSLASTSKSGSYSNGLFVFK